MSYVGVLTIGQVVIGTGTGSLDTIPTGTMGQVLISQGASSPIWGDSLGTITAVGDVTSGNAFDGTQGTTLTSIVSGFNIFVQPQGSGNDDNGGDIIIQAGLSGTDTTGGNGGSCNLIGADGFGGSPAGNSSVIGGVGGSSGLGGNASIQGGLGGSSGGTGGFAYVISGSADPSSTDGTAGQVIIRAGNHTGASLPAVMSIFGTTYSGVSGTTPSADADRIVTNATEVLTNATPKNIVGWTLDVGPPLASGTLFYSVEAKDNDAGDSQICTGQVNFASVFDFTGPDCIGNVEPVLVDISVDFGGMTTTKTFETSQVTVGSLATTWTFSAIATSGFVSVTATSSGLDTLDSLVIYYTVITNAQTHIAVNI